MKHLTDRQIQAHLDGEFFRHRTEIAHHLQTCTRCNSALLAYQKVFRVLKDNTGFELNPDFSAQVLAQLKPRTEKRVQFTVPILLGLLGLCGLGVICYFTPTTLLEEIFKTASVAFKLFKHSWTFLDNFQIFKGNNPESLAMVAFTLAVILLLDRFVFQAKLRGLGMR